LGLLTAQPAAAYDIYWWLHSHIFYTILSNHLCVCFFCKTRFLPSTSCICCIVSLSRRQQSDGVSHICSIFLSASAFCGNTCGHIHADTLCTNTSIHLLDLRFLLNSLSSFHFFHLVHCFIFNLLLYAWPAISAFHIKVSVS